MIKLHALPQTLGCTLLTLVTLVVSGISNASEVDWHPVIACQYVVPDSARLACYDETVRHAAKSSSVKPSTIS